MCPDRKKVSFGLEQAYLLSVGSCVEGKHGGLQKRYV